MFWRTDGRRARGRPRAARRVSSPIQIQGDPEDSRSPRTSPWVSSLILSMNRLIDRATLGKCRGATRRRTWAAGREFLGVDVHDAGDVGGGTVVVRAVDCRDELVVLVLGVLEVLAALIAVVELAVRKVMTSAYSSRTLSVFVAQSSPRSRASADHAAATCYRCSRSGRHPARASPIASSTVTTTVVAHHRIRSAPVDQIPEGALDGVEWAEPERPGPQQRHQVREGSPVCPRGLQPAPRGRRSASTLSPSMSSVR